MMQRKSDVAHLSRLVKLKWIEGLDLKPGERQFIGNDDEVCEFSSNRRRFGAATERLLARLMWPTTRMKDLSYTESICEQEREGC